MATLSLMYQLKVDLTHQCGTARDGVGWSTRVHILVVLTEQQSDCGLNSSTLDYGAIILQFSLCITGG